MSEYQQGDRLTITYEQEGGEVLTSDHVVTGHDGDWSVILAPALINPRRLITVSQDLFVEQRATNIAVRRCPTCGEEIDIDDDGCPDA